MRDELSGRPSPGFPGAFWWLWTSTLANRLGAFVATFMALYLTLDRGYSASYAGLVAALQGLGGVISSLGAGVMTDRLGRRPTLLVAQASTAVSVAALGFVRDPVAIAAVAFLVGMASNASRPAVQAMMADIVRPEDRIRALGHQSRLRRLLHGRGLHRRLLPHRADLPAGLGGAAGGDG